MLHEPLSTKSRSESASLVPRVTIDLVLFALLDEQLQVFTLRRSIPPSTQLWSLPTAEIDIKQDHSLEQVALRQLKTLFDQEGDHKVTYLEQVKTVGNADRDPKGWSLTVIYYGFMVFDADQPPMPTEYAQWQPLESIVHQKFAFDHQQILQESFHRLQSKSLYTSVPVFLLPEFFTLTDLQRAYEIVLGFKVEKKSFRRRILEANLLEETDQVRRANHRPAQIYRSIAKTPHIFHRMIEGVRSA